MRKPRRTIRFLGIAAVAGAIGLAGSAYTNTNTFTAEPKAGSGSQTISGYEVSDVHYNLNATNPESIDSINFTLDSAPGASATIKYRLADGSSWSANCTATAASVAACAAPAGSTVAGTTNLTVVVAD